MVAIFINADFHTKTHAKCLLTGEHAVLRSYPALVLPLLYKFMTWHYWRTDSPLTIDLYQAPDDNLIELFWQVLREALNLLQQPTLTVTGKFVIELAMPIGAGMGFSAAFCVGLTRWLIWQQWLPAEQLFTFARTLENYFHGQSSGVDIVGSLYDYGVQFCLPDDCQPLTINWQPHLYLSYSGKPSLTTQCVHQVNALHARDATLGNQLDQQMAQSVIDARLALTQISNWQLLQQALQLGLDCFKQWGLVNQQLQAHMQQLLAAGALAVKPTGAGNGGYVLSLWPSAQKDLLSVW